MDTLELPEAAGVPEIRPFDVLTDNPEGRPVALKLVGLLEATIWYENAEPTLPEAESALVITGAGGGGGGGPDVPTPSG
jgi:hypothetical protein